MLDSEVQKMSSKNSAQRSNAASHSMSFGFVNNGLHVGNSKSTYNADDAIEGSVHHRLRLASPRSSMESHANNDYHETMARREEVRRNNRYAQQKRAMHYQRNERQRTKRQNYNSGERNGVTRKPSPIMEDRNEHKWQSGVNSARSTEVNERDDGVSDLKVILNRAQSQIESNLHKTSANSAQLETIGKRLQATESKCQNLEDTFEGSKQDVDKRLDRTLHDLTSTLTVRTEMSAPLRYATCMCVPPNADEENLKVNQRVAFYDFNTDENGAVTGQIVHIHPDTGDTYLSRVTVCEEGGGRYFSNFGLNP